VVQILEEFKSGESVGVLCREYNVARSKNYIWRMEFGGIDRPLLKKLKKLEKVNVRLTSSRFAVRKKIAAKKALDIDSLKNTLGKDW